MKEKEDIEMKEDTKPDWTEVSAGGGAMHEETAFDLFNNGIL
jgi:hypothetical protein